MTVRGGLDLGRDAIEDRLAVAVSQDQAGVAQHLEVVRQEALIDLQHVVELATCLAPAISSRSTARRVGSATTLSLFAQEAEAACFRFLATTFI